MEGEGRGGKARGERYMERKRKRRENDGEKRRRSIGSELNEWNEREWVDNMEVEEMRKRMEEEEWRDREEGMKRRERKARGPWKRKRKNVGGLIVKTMMQ